MDSTATRCNSLLFKVDEIVIVSGLKKAGHLNGVFGQVAGPPSTKSSRIPVQFAENRQLSTKLILPDNLKKLPDKDDPRIAYARRAADAISGAERSIEDQIRIENGSGKLCATCHCELGGKYHVKVSNETYFCEEHYVATYIKFKSPDLNRFCAICHEFVPMRDAKALPSGIMDSVYPDGYLSDGTKRIGFDRPKDPHKLFWAHTNCLTCYLCKAQLCNERIELNVAFSTNLDPLNQTALFHCLCSPGTNTDCKEKNMKYLDAQYRLECIREMSVVEMCALLLKERNLMVSEIENDIYDEALLVRKIVVTENVGQKRDKLKNIVTTYQEDGEEEDCFVLKGRSQPGAEFLDVACKHGAQWKFDDTPMQSMKRDLVADFIIEHAGRFSLEYLHSNNNSEEITPLENSMGAVVDFFTNTQERYKLFQSDIEERFIPKQLWNAAVHGACEEEGCEDYTSLTLCGSLIAHAILDALESKHPGLLEDNELFELFGLDSAPLKLMLTDVTSSPATMYQFMNSSKYRACDCMQYVATAAEMNLLRHKPMRVKMAKYRCAFCQQVLADPKWCSLCNEVAYCHALCQKPHWKIHKKECSGRKAKKKDFSSSY